MPPERVGEVTEGPYRLLRNKRRRRGKFKMVGPDAGGTFWTIVLEPTREPGVWRPVTGWQTEPGELSLYHGGKSK
ncbi:MAG: hypothetical protein HY675_25345 [Chloroflexi bacterium]|nr:hypothetical protein [Chloroflexota bacterium]